MLRTMPRPKKSDPAPAPAATPEEAAKKKRNAIFITLDDETERRLQAFIEGHRVKPDRAAVGLLAIRELLDKEGIH